MPFIQANGKQLFYMHRKPDGAQDPEITFLMIHGLGSSHSYYVPLFQRLVSAGFGCLAYDTYGSGLSKFQGGSQDVQSMSEDALGLMAALNLDPKRTVVVGHSMGGMIANSLASQRPFAGAVLLGPVHPGSGMTEAFAKRIKAVETNGMEAMADMIPWAATGAKSTPTHHAWIRTLLLSQQPEGYMSLCSVIAGASPPPYANITSPVLIIAGAEDKSTPLQGCQTILDGLGTESPSKKIEVIEGVGHWLCVEAADEVGRLIQEFAMKLKTAEPTVASN
ncbi:hypothetical protein FQN57_000202 [Myotisia sp. PD_48]|nr:hypothetical protein FQN57_000202 [Myotisia sp. PD_48]